MFQVQGFHYTFSNAAIYNMMLEKLLFMKSQVSLKGMDSKKSA